MSIRTIEDLFAACVEDELSGCWTHRGRLQAKDDRIRYRINDVSRSRPFARAAAELSRQEVLPQRWCWMRVGCLPTCCNPEHVTVGSRKQWLAVMTQRGEFRGSPARKAANQRTAAPRRVLTDEQAAEIRVAPGRLIDVAAEYGISKSLVSAIRRGTRYAPLIRGASVFAWRP